ncbi:MAG: M56 family metallopeptidase [Armatimonadia bacterium]
MAQIGAVGGMLLLCSGAASLILFLPIMVAAESLHNCPPTTARRFWLIANLLPLLSGTILTILAFVFVHDPSGQPSDIRGHWCLQRVASLPDAHFRLRLSAATAVGLILFAVVRLVMSWYSSRRAESLAHRLLARQGKNSSDASAIVLPTDEADCFSLGLSTPVVLMTSGLTDVLDEDEAAAVLSHEHCHARNRDSRLELLIRAVSDPLLWLPTTHYYLYAFRAAVERVCDASAAASHSSTVLASALRKMAALKRSRQLRLQGDLAPLRPTFPGYASPEQRLAALEEEHYPSLALPLPVMLATEALLGFLALLWVAKPLHDTLYCLASTLPDLLTR